MKIFLEVQKLRNMLVPSVQSEKEVIQGQNSELSEETGS